MTSNHTAVAGLSAPRRNLAGVLVIGVALVMAVLGGAATAFLPWWLIMALLIMPVLLIVGVVFPELSLVVMFVLICGLVPEALAPQISMGPGVIKAHELAILLLAALAFLRAQSGAPFKPYWPWFRPVMLFFALVAMAVFVGKLNGATIKDALSEGRVAVAWLIIFMVVSLVRTEAQLRRLVGGIVFVGVLVALALIAQFATGKSFIQNARVETLVTMNQANPDVIRSLAGGGIYFVVFSGLLLLGRLMTRSIAAWLALPLLALLVAGLVVTFGRGVWIASTLVALLMSYRLARLKGVAGLVATGVASGVVGLALLASFKPAVIEVALDRVLSTTQETLGRNTSLGWRAEETRFALKRISGSPVLGLGMGVAYKPITRMNGVTITESDEVLTRYIHNAYLGLWLKFGILGLFAAAWFSWSTVRRGLQVLKQAIDPRHKALAASALAAFLVPVIVSVTQPEWLTQTGIAFFALMPALLVCLHRVQGAASVPDAASAKPVRPHIVGRRFS